MPADVIRSGRDETALCQPLTNMSVRDTAIDLDRSLSNKSSRTLPRPEKSGEPHSVPLYSTVVVHQNSAKLPAVDSRGVDGMTSERSIYDQMIEHCYANVEKDESGRLLNRDTLAFRTSDYETVKPVVLLQHSNGQLESPTCHNNPLSGGSTLKSNQLSETAVQMHRTCKNLDVIGMDISPNPSLPDRNLLDSAVLSKSPTGHVPYHTGRSTFYQRLESGEGLVLGILFVTLSFCSCVHPCVPCVIPIHEFRVHFFFSTL
jgi:hypothetical protein